MTGRPKGSRDPDYEDKRRELVDALTRACLEDPHQRLSMRQMAEASGVTPPTLTHYFSDRRGIVFAILEQSWKNAAQFIEASRHPTGSLQDWIRRELDQFLLAFSRFGLDRLNAWGINEGLADRDTGPIYLRFFLEPTLQAAEHWLSEFQQRGDIPEDVDPRHAALALLSPCLVLFLHQNALGGNVYRPADVDKFMSAHAERFASYLQSAPGR
jgi:AcrR family transcriptional regulator